MRLYASRRLLDSRGQGLAEYIIIVIVVAIVVIVAVRMFGGSVIEQFEGATEKIDTIGDGGTEPSDTSPDSASARAGKTTAPGADDSVGESEGSGSGGEGGDGSGDSSGLEELRPAGVGEKEPVGRLEVDWSTMGFWAVLVCGAGLFFVFQLYTKEKKKKPKKEKRNPRLSGNGDQ